MVTVETATPDRADGICRVCAASWREAYADVLSAEYVEANVRTFYRPERIEDEIDESDGTAGWLVALRDGGVEGDEPARDDGAGIDGAGTNRAETDGVSETVVGTVRDDRPEPGVGEVSGLYVHPDQQGRGIGSRLLATLTERQRDRGATEQRVYVFADHDDAIEFYDSKGFDADEWFPAATVDGVDPDCEAIRLTRSI